MQQKNCPRCNKAFTCKPANITQCQCSGIAIKPELKIFLKQRYKDCLCADCIDCLQQEVTLFKENAFK